MMNQAKATERTAVATPASFSSVSTTGSTPAVVQRIEATPIESVQYDIAAMVKSRMTRLLVVCDMHGADLREILGPKVDQLNVHDGRSVMREAILAEMNRLNRDIQKTLDRVACP